MATRTPFQRLTLVVVTALALIATLVPMSIALAGPFAFTFDGESVGTSAEQINAAGVSLSSPFMPNVWRVVDNNGQFVTMSGRVLQNQSCNAALIVELDQVHTFMSMRFAIDPNAAVFIVDGWLGEPGPGTKVFSRNSQGSYQGSPLRWDEGAIRSRGIRFDHLVIYSPGGCAAIDDLSIS